MISLARSTRRAVSQVLQMAPVMLWRKLVPKSELGFCYHIVSDRPVPHVKHYRVLDTATFESDLEYLQARFEFIAYEQLVQRRTSTNSRRDNSVILTFDDGFAECATVVAPLLQRHGLSCIFFVITDLIDNQEIFRESAASLCIQAILQLSFGQVESIMTELALGARLRPTPGALFAPAMLPLEVADLGPGLDPRLLPLLQWLLQLPAREEGQLVGLLARLGIDPRSYLRKAQPYLTTELIRQLHADGFAIGAHSLSHRRLQDLPRAEAEHEIVESCRIVREITGQTTVPFAFPYFGGGLDRPWLARLREQHDFIGLFFDTDGLREDEPFVVQRVFGERFSRDRTLDAILRRAWARPSAWGRRSRPSGPAGQSRAAP
jgi:peptidoglycan/xylan/chitin deacetylase (PgdA/CDA1 family)